MSQFKKLSLISQFYPFFLIFFHLFVSIAVAADKVVVIPLFDDDASCCEYEGTLNGTRWCDNGDGTVTDLNTCLVWLKNAMCNDTLAGISKTDGWLTWDAAIIWSSAVISGKCGLSDGSALGDWRLPLANELAALANGNEPVREATPRAFVGVHPHPGFWAAFWSSTTRPNLHDDAFFVQFGSGGINVTKKSFEDHGAWPVRGGN